MKNHIYAAISILLWLQTLNAGPLLPLSVLELTKASDVVLHGKVVSKKVARDEDGRIFTSVVLDIHELWKGEINDSVFEIVHGGGILGNRKVTAPYQVKYGLNQEVVVFCRLNSKGKGVTIGLIQGKFDVLKTDYTSKLYVRNLFHGGPPPEKKPFKPRYRLPNQLPLSLESLKAQVEGGKR